MMTEITLAKIGRSMKKCGKRTAQRPACEEDAEAAGGAE
jgi:hypothetical protein